MCIDYLNFWVYKSNLSTGNWDLIEAKGNTGKGKIIASLDRFEDIVTYLKAGNALAFCRRLDYQHFAIYAGDGYIIHRSAPPEESLHHECPFCDDQKSRKQQQKNEPSVDEGENNNHSNNVHPCVCMGTSLFGELKDNNGNC